MRASYILSFSACLASALGAPVENLTLSCSGLNGLRSQCPSVEAPHRREVFHVGGHYELNPESRMHVLLDKLYVEKLTPFPRVTKPYPLVFFHGGGFSGAVSCH